MTAFKPYKIKNKHQNNVTYAGYFKQYNISEYICIPVRVSQLDKENDK